VSARGDEVQVAADASLGRVNVAEIVRTVDDPEFLVAGGEIEDFFVFGQNDERRKAELGANGNDVFLLILHDPRRGIRRAVSRRNVEHGCSKNNDGEDAKKKAVPLDVQHLFHRGAPFEMDWCRSELWSRSERSPTNHCTARTTAVNAALRKRGRNKYSGSRTAASSKRR
jgi:hypothetical protein